MPCWAFLVSGLISLIPETISLATIDVCDHVASNAPAFARMTDPPLPTPCGVGEIGQNIYCGFFFGIHYT